MPRTPKSWTEKMQARPPHTVRLDKDFAGIPKGSRLLISSPLEVEHYLRTCVACGQTKPVQQMRKELAHIHGVDATCPVSSAIFLRIVAEAACDQMEAGAAVDDVAPFWRVVDPHCALAKRLRVSSEWIQRQRDVEAAAVSH